MHIEFDLQPPVTAIYFEGYFNEYSYGDLALDDLELSKGPCRDKLQSIEWSEWSECSVSCGQGLRTRRRICAGQNKSRECENAPAALVESEMCLQAECIALPSKSPEWSEWSAWSECTPAVNCSESYQFRIRKCLNRELGLCAGEATDYRSCPKCVKKEDATDESSVGKKLLKRASLFENLVWYLSRRIRSSSSTSGSGITKNFSNGSSSLYVASTKFADSTGSEVPLLKNKQSSNAILATFQLKYYTG